MPQSNRLLFLSHCVPYPPNKGERTRAFEQLKALSAHFRITLAAAGRSADELASAKALAPWCERIVAVRAGGAGGTVAGGLKLLAGKSITEGYFRAGRIGRELAGGKYDVLFAYSSAMVPVAMAIPAPARIIDLVDVDSAKWSAYADGSTWPMKLLYAYEAERVRALERTAVEGADAVLVCSRAEAGLLLSDTGRSRRAGTDATRVIVVGNGVDTERFQPSDRDSRAEPSIVFTGTMNYRPNAEAVCWFARHVWGPLKRRLGKLTLRIVGRDPPRAVRSLGRLDGVEVTGPVDDVRPHLAAATVAIAPLRIARGVQNKVLEAMAMGRAAVVSPQAAQGLDVQIGRDLLVADRPAQWLETVFSLVCDTARRERIEQAARKRVLHGYSWEQQLGALVSLCRQPRGARTLADAPSALESPAPHGRGR